MAEYISKDAVLKAFKLIAKNPNKDYQRGMQDTIDCLVPEVIADIPTADVQPVKRGKWLNNKYEYIVKIDGNLIHAYCSNCKRIAFTIDSINRKIDYELCPHCGANMRNE